MKHVMLAQRVIDRSEPALRKQLKAAVAAMPAEAAQDAGALRAALGPVLDARLAVLAEEYARGNAELDTAAEALRMSQACQEPQTFVGSNSLNGSLALDAR